MSNWILLPGLGLMTIVFLAGSTEFIGARMFGASATTLDSCLVTKDNTAYVRAIPNSVCREKAPETSLIEYRFDNCGYRTGTSCGPKQPGTYRIVMAGSSVAMGSRVRLEDAFGTLLPEKISRDAGHRVELYNEAISLSFVKATAHRFDDVMKAQPDLILWVLTPLDLAEGGELRVNPKPQSALTMVKDAVLKGDLIERVRNRFDYSPAGFAIQHALIESESQSQYIRSWLQRPDPDTGFLRSDFTSLWKQRMEEFDSAVAGIAGESRAAGVPLVVTFLPNRAQAAMLSSGYWPEGYDPYRIEKELHARVARHGGIYLDVLQQFRQYPDISEFYYPVDGHPDARAHRVFADVLARSLTNGTVAALESPHSAPALP